jgi:Uma2 family endonuclease
VTYGAAGIPVYWIVNLRDGQVELYNDPDPGPHVSGVGGIGRGWIISQVMTSRL